MLKLVIHGKPVIQQRPRRGKYGNFYDPSSKERKRLSQELLAARNRKNRFSPYDGHLGLKVVFHFYSHGKRKTDLSNMLKALEDSGNGILWKDDDQIDHLEVMKRLSEKSNERTEIEIMEK